MLKGIMPEWVTNWLANISRYVMSVGEGHFAFSTDPFGSQPKTMHNIEKHW
jgi:hypothetical protein